MRAVRAAIGPDIALTVDANCGWEVDTAIRCVNELADCNLALVEQPTPDGDYAALARVRRETRVPVMADDMCFNLVHAQELIRNECCDVISVYPGKQGGIRKAQRDRRLRGPARRGLLDRLEPGARRRHGRDGPPGGRPAPNMQVEKYPGDMLGADYHEIRVATQPDPDRRADHHDQRRARPRRGRRLGRRAKVPLGQ